MARRGRAFLIPALAASLSACGSASGSPAGSATELQEALTVDLPGYVSAAARPVPTTLCDPDPAGDNVVQPALPADLGSPISMFYEKADATLEAYAWTASDPELTARDIVEQAQANMATCRWSVPLDQDLDGDGVAETPGSEVQATERWTESGWTGARVHRVVSGIEQVDRTLAFAGDVVLLVVLRADTDDPAVVATADEYLAAVGDDLG